MRPDKKGNRKRDERRNGPKTGPQKATGSQHSSGSTQKPDQKPSGPAQKPAGPVQKPTGPAEKPAATARQAGDKGPRVLEPAAQPSEAARYRRREIHSNWHRYEEEPVTEPETEPDQDFLRGDTFTDLLAASSGDAGHFQLTSERSWLESGGGGGTSGLLTLDVYRSAAALSRLPLPRRLDIDTKHFTEEELHQFSLEADTCSTAAADPAVRTADPAPSAVPSGQPPDSGRRDPDPAQPTDPRVAEVAPSAEVALPAEVAPPAEHASTAEPTAGSDRSPVDAAAGAGGSGAVTAAPAAEPAPALLQDDWLDSVLSDED